MMKAPAGYKHFTKEQLDREKIKFLKSYDLPKSDIDLFLTSQPNSRNMNEIIKKLGVKGYEEQFLRYEVEEERHNKHHKVPQSFEQFLSTKTKIVSETTKPVYTVELVYDNLVVDINKHMSIYKNNPSGVLLKAKEVVEKALADLENKLKKL